MYEKNLTEDLRLRLSKTDMDFLRDLSEQRSLTVSQCIRSIIGEYRRSIETISSLTDALKLVKEKGRLSQNGDTESDINNLV